MAQHAPALIDKSRRVSGCPAQKISIRVACVKIKSESDCKVIERLVDLLRGLKQGSDLDIAESAVRFEHELTEQVKHWRSDALDSDKMRAISEGKYGTRTGR